MYHTCYCINSVSHQMLSAGILGHSPVAQGFFQSYQPQMSASYPYSTPLGPLSPFAAVSGSLPVRYYHHILLTSSHWHLSTLSPFTLPPLHPLTLHTGTSPPPHLSHYYFSILLPQSSGPGPLQHVQTVGPGIGFTSTSPLPQSTGTPSPFHYGPAHRYTMAQVVTHTSQNRAPGSPTKPSPMVSELTLFPGLQSQLTGWKAW